MTATARSILERDCIYQPALAELHSDGDDGSFCRLDLVDLFHSFLRSDGDVLDILDEWLILVLALDDRAQGIRRHRRRGRLLRLEVLFGEGETAVDDASGSAFLRVQVLVAGRHGKTVGFARHWDNFNLDIHVEVVHESLDEDALRGILLSEECVGRRHDIEELGHDGGNAAEVARTTETFREIVKALRNDVASVVLGVHVLRRWHEDEVDAFLSQELSIAFKGTWVLGVILIRSELRWVDEDTGGHDVALLLGSTHQRQMASMQTLPMVGTKPTEVPAGSCRRASWNSCTVSMICKAEDENKAA